MAAYGAVSEFAKVLGETKHASLLEETLAEEKQTDEKVDRARRKD
jgi:ferritin-like metal-binding protein YciE